MLVWRGQAKWKKSVRCLIEIIFNVIYINRLSHNCTSQWVSFIFCWILCNIATWHNYHDNRDNELYYRDKDFSLSHRPSSTTVISLFINILGNWHNQSTSNILWLQSRSAITFFVDQHVSIPCSYILINLAKKLNKFNKKLLLYVIACNVMYIWQIHTKLTSEFLSMHVHMYSVHSPKFFFSLNKDWKSVGISCK